MRLSNEERGYGPRRQIDGIGVVDAYFSHLAAVVGRRDGPVVVGVGHLVQSAYSFWPAVREVVDVGLILPKPKSVDVAVREYVKDVLRIPVAELDRAWSANAEAVVETLRDHGIVNRDVVLVDIGGYFAPALNDIAAAYAGRLLGVMEGTENGVQKYEEAIRHRGPLAVPVTTVARSPLKLPEDYLVGTGVVFSVEAVLREHAQILQTRTACVIGYGRVGRGVAAALRGRGLSTVVYDINPVAKAEASARGYQVFERLEYALQISDLVVCATGNKSLDAAGFAQLRPGTVVASVTSADDEFDVGALQSGYERVPLGEHLQRIHDDDQNHFLLINDGNAANFVHGAVLGPALQLIEGEKLACVHALASGRITSSGVIEELDRATRETVASIWNEHFI